MKNVNIRRHGQKRERERKEKEDDILHLVKTYSPMATTFLEQIRQAEKNVRLFESFKLIISGLSYDR